MDNVIGSFYTNDLLPQFCYTIYSLWGDANKKRKHIKNDAVMRFKFSLNASRRHLEEPCLNIPSNPMVQMEVHSPYFLPSPYKSGMSYMGGEDYSLRLAMVEKHLLPAPYQTNCTDYLGAWREKGGKGPTDVLAVVQECLMNTYYDAQDCVPLSVDYPHDHRICNICSFSQKKCAMVYNGSMNHCLHLENDYNQPCDSISYKQSKENLSILKVLNISHISTRGPEKLVRRLFKHNCEDYNMWKRECSEINIEVRFDRFQVSKYFYKAKYEAIEVFSVFGGYVGIWLGISLFSIYDFLWIIVISVRSRLLRRIHQKRVFIRRRKILDIPKRLL